MSRRGTPRGKFLTSCSSADHENGGFQWTRGLTVGHPLWAFTLGDRWWQRTSTQPPLWPSDHAGVVAIANLD